MTNDYPVTIMDTINQFFTSRFYEPKTVEGITCKVVKGAKPNEVIFVIRGSGDYEDEYWATLKRDYLGLDEIESLRKDREMGMFLK